ncbi:MAG: precorrin-3B C(17)-methyltransferase [Lachnospiraceae bacterium]|nr:precorrin-3B C(17)-methyltransferase [Lachnospiraceae bacterium]
MGRLYVVGIGPGGIRDMTARAAGILKECEVIAGYDRYIDRIRQDFQGKEWLCTGMAGEEERCRRALETASQGRRTALISGGDPGIYGMASLALSLSLEYPGVEIEILPGLTAATAGAALLGAPIANDLAVISLSDYHVSWEQIAQRLRLAAQGDFCIVLYNPASRARPDSLKKACAILRESLPEDRLCALAHQIGREGERTELCTLGRLSALKADMSSTVFIGNSRTREINGYMVTPRL